MKITPFMIENRFARKGLLIDYAGVQAEVSPLPGYSHETVDQAYVQLQNLPASVLYPSVYFGLQSVRLALTHPEPPFRAKRHLFLYGTPEEIRARIRPGYDTAKVKISHLGLEEAIDIVRELRSRFRLRLDFNRNWPKEKVIAFFSHFPKDAFDYSEEPLPDPADLVHFPHAFALDETLREQKAGHLIALENCRALIFKPTLQGRLPPYNKPIILSPSYEGPVGLAHLERWVHAYNLTDYCHGLEI